MPILQKLHEDSPRVPEMGTYDIDMDKGRIMRLIDLTGQKFLGATCTVCAHVELFKEGKNVSPK